MKPADTYNRLGGPGKTGAKASGCSNGGEGDPHTAHMAAETQSKLFSGSETTTAKGEPWRGGWILTSRFNTFRKQSIGGRGAWRCARTVFVIPPMNHPLWTPFRLKDTHGATALATVATTLTRQAHP